ncbi:hypothetical protein ACH4C6_02800 [Streptomyces sp. NPDC017943]|uniref:hypothetical protein n=1 Tax=Streptomyces sp. NPDC017943 TaxID=3365019 RepID=UPI0037A7E19F
MRGTARHTCLAALVAGLLATGTAGCAPDGGGGREDRAGTCAEGTYTWSGVRREQRLTALSDPIRFTEEPDTYSLRLEAVGDTVYRPSVTGTPRGTDAAGVIKELGRHLKTEGPLAGPSRTERPAEDHFVEYRNGLGRGAYYAWAQLDLVDADFTRTCGDGEPARGHVRTWEGSGAALLPCSAEPPDEAAGRIAAQRRCPAGSEAAEGA